MSMVISRHSPIISWSKQSGIIEIEIERLRPFKEHPFQVKDHA
ncbi:hypothetical protein [Coprococcus comes]|nr:hypothetical protein [Coprococcus comes]